MQGLAYAKEFPFRKSIDSAPVSIIANRKISLTSAGNKRRPRNTYNEISVFPSLSVGMIMMIIIIVMIVIIIIII